jgi:1-aminocyclopropane-1-carboxylate deaminase
MDKFLPDSLTDVSWDYPALIQPLQLPEITAAHIHADVLRLDTLHPVVSGNKWFKLKGHLQKALPQSPSAILTFGGAWSNHIIATAYAARETGIHSIGIIRGERPAKLSATLEAAIASGIQLEFVSRQEYTEKNSPVFRRRLMDRFPGAYIVPEGGAGIPGIDASSHILRGIPASVYSHILCAVGTGSTFLGLAHAAGPNQAVIGIPVLKGMTEPSAVIRELAASEPDATRFGSLPSRHSFAEGYHFGGYARPADTLIAFMNRLHRDTAIPTDFVYTGKLFYAVLDRVRQHLFPPDSRLLIIHSGGLQGNQSLPPGLLDF